MNTRSEWYIDSNLTSGIFYTKEETINDVVKNFDIRRYYSAEGKSITINLIGATPVEEQVIIQNHSNPLNKDKVDKKMLISVDSLINVGSYITYNNELWMVCSQINLVDDAYKSCMINKCNWLLEWQQEKGEIISRQCVVTNASQYNSGVDSNKIMMLGSNQYMVYLPFDEETSKLSYDKRIFIDNNYKIPYKITRPDNVSMFYNDNGLIVLIMTQDLLSERDRPDLHICDYFEPTIQSSTTCEIVYTNSPIIYIGGNAKKFTAVFKDDEGNILNGVAPVWSTNISDNDKTKILFTDNEDGTCSIKVINDLSLSGQVVRLSLIDESGDYSTYVDISVRGVI